MKGIIGLWLRLSVLVWAVPSLWAVNNDGKTDIYWRNYSTGGNAAWAMDGVSYSSSVTVPTLSDTGWKQVGIGDFNNDGHTDIVWRHSTGVNYVWYMQGANLITAAPVQTESDSNWEIVGAGSFSGANDATVDLLWRHKTSGDNGIWQLNGTTFVSSHTLPWASTSYKVGGTGDAKCDTDSDGLPDLWERKWFGNLTPGANDNPDGDSLTNLQEFQAGTDPLVAGAIPALAEAVDNLDLIFTTGGTVSWYANSGGYVGDDSARSLSMDSGQSWMETKVVGPGTLGFNCLVSCDPNAGYLRVDLNGSEYYNFAGSQESGWETTSHLNINLSSGTNTIRWTYVQEWAEEGYDNAASVDYVTVDYGGSSGTPSLGEALDNTSLTWSTSGYTVWSGQTLVASPFGGGDAAKSGTVSPGQESYLYTSVTGPGLLNFYWKLSAISGYHALRFKVDWSEIEAIGGSQETGWVFGSYSIGSGTHTVSWHYTESSDNGQEAEYGYVDWVRFEPDSDIDGLPDHWETANFGGASQNGEGDFDADGLANLQEYLQGKNPTLPELRVKIAAPRKYSLLP